MRHIIFVRGGQITTGMDAVTRQIEKSRDGAYIMSITKEKSKATTSMFGFLFGYVYPAILEEMGQEPTVEAFKELDRELKLRFGAAELATSFEMQRRGGFEKKVTGKPFIKVDEVMTPKSKSDYTVQEMQDYWMALQNLVAEMWGRTLKDPDPNWKDGWGKSVKNGKSEFIKCQHSKCGHNDCRRCTIECAREFS